MFKRVKKVDEFKVGDLVVLKKDKKSPKTIYQVKYISDGFCNLRLASNNAYCGWVREKFIKKVER